MSAISLLQEEANWRSRKVQYSAGDWDAIQTVLPEFDLVPFTVGQGEPANPFLQTVMRRPLSAQSDLSQSLSSLTNIHSPLTGMSQGYVAKGSSRQGLILTICATK